MIMYTYNKYHYSYLIFILRFIFISNFYVVCGSAQACIKQNAKPRLATLKSAKLSKDCTMIDVSKNRIAKIGPNEFKRFSTLEVLILNHNLLPAIPNLTFVAAGLKQLEINTNKIAHIDKDDLIGFTSLEMLDLKRNDIVLFPDFTHVGSTLKIVNFFDNKITLVPTPLLRKLQVIEEIDISKNVLTTLPAFNELNTLVHIELYDNDIKGILYPEQFKNLPSVTYVSLGVNKITHFPDLIYIADIVKAVRFRNNLIRYVPSHLVNQLIVLDYLDLSGNFLTEFSIYPGPKTLTFLRLENNLLTEYPILSDMSFNLQILRIYGNPIVDITPDRFIFLKRNESADFLLEANHLNITTFPPMIGLDLNHVTILAEYVPLVCDAKLLWMFLPVPATLKSVGGSCDGPSPLSGMPLENVTLQDIRDLQFKEIGRNIISSIAEQLAINLYANTLPVETSYTMSVKECIQICGITPGCIYINYLPITYLSNSNLDDYYKSKGNCHFSSPYEGDMLGKPEDATGWVYINVNTT